MSKRLIIILWLIAAALGLGVFAVKSRENGPQKGSAQRQAGETLFSHFPANEVAAITVSGAEGTTHLEKKDGRWQVRERDAYPAKTTAINELIRTMADLKVAGAIDDAADYAARFGIDESATEADKRGTTVIFTNSAGNEVAKVSLGRTIGADDASPMDFMGGGGASGRFVFNHGDKSAIYKTSEMFGSLSPEPKTWLEEEFIKVEKVKSVAVTAPGSNDIAWKLSRDDENSEFTLEGATADDELDATKATALKNLFSNARFEDVVPATDVEKRSQSDQKRVATVETVEGFTYTFDITPVKATNPAPEDGENPAAATPETYLLSVDVAATLPKERKAEADEKPEDAKSKDEAFQTRLKSLSEKLTQEQALKGRVFEVSSYVVDPLIQSRESFKKTAQPAAGAQNIQGLPPGFTMPGATPARRPVEATTPPIAVPSMEESDGE